MRTIVQLVSWRFRTPLFLAVAVVVASLICGASAHAGPVPVLVKDIRPGQKLEANGIGPTTQGPRAVQRFGDGVLGLFDVLRMVQLFTALGYRCADTPGATEDGYCPGPNP